MANENYIFKILFHAYKIFFARIKAAALVSHLSIKTTKSYALVFFKVFYKCTYSRWL